jgi:hypothetical protein
MQLEEARLSFFHFRDHCFLHLPQEPRTAKSTPQSPIVWMAAVQWRIRFSKPPNRLAQIAAISWHL